MNGAKQIVDQLTEAVDQSNLCVILRGGESGMEALLVADEKGRWSIPGGHAKGDEDFKQAAQREVKEETGLEVNPEPLFWARHVARGPGRPINLFYAVVEDGNDARPGGGDVTEVKWTRVNQLGGLNGTDCLAIAVAVNRVHSTQQIVDQEVEIGESLGYAVGNVLAPVPIVEGIYLRLGGTKADEYASRIKSWAEGLGWPVKLVSSCLFESTKDALNRASHNRRLTPTLEALIFASDSLWHYESAIGPALAEGCIVVETGPSLDILRLQSRGIQPDILEEIMSRVRLPTIYFNVGDAMNLQTVQMVQDAIEDLKRLQVAAK